MNNIVLLSKKKSQFLVFIVLNKKKNEIVLVILFIGEKNLKIRKGELIIINVVINK